MDNIFLIKVNNEYKEQLEYLRQIEERLVANGYNITVEEADVKVCEYYIDGDLYLEDNFLGEDGIISFLTSKQEHTCTGCGGGCSH